MNLAEWMNEPLAPPDFRPERFLSGRHSFILGSNRSGIGDVLRVLKENFSSDVMESIEIDYSQLFDALSKLGLSDANLPVERDYRKFWEFSIYVFLCRAKILNAGTDVLKKDLLNKIPGSNLLYAKDLELFDLLIVWMSLGTSNSFRSPRAKRHSTNPSLLSKTIKSFHDSETEDFSDPITRNLLAELYRDLFRILHSDGAETLSVKGRRSKTTTSTKEAGNQDIFVFISNVTTELPFDVMQSETNREVGIFLVRDFIRAIDRLSFELSDADVLFFATIENSNLSNVKLSGSEVNKILSARGFVVNWELHERSLGLLDHHLEKGLRCVESDGNSYNDDIAISEPAYLDNFLIDDPGLRRFFLDALWHSPEFVRLIVETVGQEKKRSGQVNLARVQRGIRKSCIEMLEPELKRFYGSSFGGKLIRTVGSRKSFVEEDFVSDVYALVLNEAWQTEKLLRDIALWHDCLDINDLVRKDFLFRGILVEQGARTTRRGVFSFGFLN